LKHLQRTLQFPTDRHQWVVTRFPNSEVWLRYKNGDKSAIYELSRVRDTVEFYWIPWAYGTARAYLRSHAKTVREKVEMRRVLTHLLDLSKQEVEIGKKSWIFGLDELAIALSTR
jgi:hypothetical protein